MPSLASRRHVLVRVIRPGLHDGQGAVEIGGEKGSEGELGRQPGREFREQLEAGLDLTALHRPYCDSLGDGPDHPAGEVRVLERLAEDLLGGREPRW